MAILSAQFLLGAHPGKFSFIKCDALTHPNISSGGRSSQGNWRCEMRATLCSTLPAPFRWSLSDFPWIAIHLTNAGKTPPSLPINIDPKLYPFPSRPEVVLICRTMINVQPHMGRSNPVRYYPWLLIQPFSAFQKDYDADLARRRYVLAVTFATIPKSIHLT